MDGATCSRKRDASEPDLQPWLSAANHCRAGVIVHVAVIGSLVVFALTYLVIASRQLHWVGLDRPAGAVVGAVAMVVVGGLPMGAAPGAVHPQLRPPAL